MARPSIPPAEKYVTAALKHGASVHSGDSVSANRAYREKMKALRELREAPARGEHVLSELTNHPDDWVKVSASTHLLPLSPSQACSVLEKVAAGQPSLARFNARIVLEEWKAGRLSSL